MTAILADPVLTIIFGTFAVILLCALAAAVSLGRTYRTDRAAYRRGNERLAEWKRRASW